MVVKVEKKRVAIVGAAGVAGQQFVLALADHPWFEVVALAGSSRSAGRTYAQALRGRNDQLNWWQQQPVPARLAAMEVVLANELDLSGLDLVFTAIESDAAKELEPIFAQRCPTISTASAFRMDPHTPLLVPGVNGEHRALIKQQQAVHGWRGFVVPIPNCTTYGLACTLAPLHRAFTVEAVIMTSMQAVSGAGRESGVLALDVIDNVIPYIPGEEEKVQREVNKILGSCDGRTVVPSPFQVSSTCTRVPVVDGHTECVFVRTMKPCSVAAARQAFLEFEPDLAGLPSAPERFFTVHDDPFRPQPRLDRMVDRGMSTHVGRLRADAALGGIKYVLLSHNTLAGAAMGAVLVAELLCREQDI
ncbi:MAG: aspartate-semialdehyde dehydrogenase [Planctomycetota bacterium]